jgi:hypothetical protein
MTIFTTGREMAPTYTGVGSRSTPPDVLHLMERIADQLCVQGYTLRSGAADGADQAFGRGAQSRAHIYLPWPGFGVVEPGALAISMGNHIEPDLERIIASVHPAWERLTIGPRKLHARNVRQLLGITLKRPSDFVICWTEDGRTIGGTATAIKLAERYDVPVYNLGVPAVLEAFQTQPVDEVIAFPRRNADGTLRPYIHLGAELPF